MLTIWPGLAVDGAIDGEPAAEAGAADAGAVAAEPPQAPAMIATTAARAASRVNVLLPMRLPFPSIRCNPWPLKRSSVPHEGRAQVAQSFTVGGPPLACLTMSSVPRTTRRTT